LYQKPAPAESFKYCGSKSGAQPRALRPERPSPANRLDLRGVFGCIEASMKKTIFAFLAAAALIGTGCVSTVSDTHTFASSFGQDSMAGRYQRTPEQVYAAALSVIQSNGVLVKEYVPHDSTNVVRSLEAKVDQRTVWVRVASVDTTTTQVDVQARTKYGFRDQNLTHELEKEIAIQLTR